MKPFGKLCGQTETDCAEISPPCAGVKVCVCVPIISLPQPHTRIDRTIDSWFPEVRTLHLEKIKSNKCGKSQIFFCLDQVMKMLLYVLNIACPQLCITLQEGGWFCLHAAKVLLSVYVTLTALLHDTADLYHCQTGECRCCLVSSCGAGDC